MSDENYQEGQPVEETSEGEAQTTPEKELEMVSVSKNEYFKLQRLANKNSKPGTLQPEKSVQSAVVETDTLIDNLTLIKDFSADEVSTLRSESKEMGVDLFKFIKSKPGQVFVENLRNQKKAEDSTLAPSQRGVSFKGKPVTEIYKDDNASIADKQAAFEANLKRVK